MSESNAAKRSTQDAAASLVREHGQNYVDAVKATEGRAKEQEVRNAPPAALQKEAQDLRGAEQTTREKSAVKGRVESVCVPRRENTLEKAGEAQEARKPGWRHIGRVPGDPDPALTESDPSSRRPLQLPTEVCERIIDWQWNDTSMLRECALVCKAWTPRCRYWMRLMISFLHGSAVHPVAASLHYFHPSRWTFLIAFSWRAMSRDRCGANARQVCTLRLVR